MKNRLCLVLWIVIAVIANVEAKPDGKDLERYFIVLKDAPVLKMQQELAGGRSVQTSQFQAKRSDVLSYKTALQAKQNQLASTIERYVSNGNVDRKFSELIDALAVTIDPADLDLVYNNPDVAYVYPIKQVQLMLTNSADLMNVPPVWEAVGGREQGGDGVYIGIVDSGFDLSHPAYRDDGFVMPEGFPKGEVDYTNNKVIAAYYFPPADAGNDVLNEGPADFNGHGTNVSSIASARLVNSPLGFLSGTAPKAYLGNYKIIPGVTFSADSDQLIAAVEQAVMDGVDIMNLSLGSLVYGDPQHDPQVLAIQNAVDLGVTVVMAAGNNPTRGRIGNPNQVADAIAVGITTNTHARSSGSDLDALRITALGNGDILFQDSTAILGISDRVFTEPYIESFTVEDLDLLDGGSYGGPEDGTFCRDATAPITIHDWLLIRRAPCRFTDMVNRAEALGAKGVIFYATETGFDTTIPGVSGTTIPSVLISNDDGLAIKKALADGETVEFMLEPQDREIDAGLISQVSAQGPSVDYTLKPDIAAVGEWIYGPVQNDDADAGNFSAGGYNWLRGSSMSSPQVAGIAALIKQMHPNWPSAWIKSALLMGARRPVRFAGSLGNASILQRGAGEVDAAASMDVDTLAVPAMLGFGKQHIFQDRAEVRWMQISNPTGQTCTYTFDPPADANGPQALISIRRFILDPGKTIDISVTLIVPEAMSDGDYENELLLSNLTTGTQYSIPFWVNKESVDPPNGNVLLVDDDLGKAVEQYYGDRLSELGIGFSYWDVDREGEFPTFSYLQSFRTIIWFMADNSLNDIVDENTSAYADRWNPRHLFETAMSRYLAEGGTLLLSGMDYFDDKLASAFSQNILYARLPFEGWDAFDGTDYDRQLTLNGIPGNPITDGLDALTLSFPAGNDNFTDLIASSNRSVSSPMLGTNGNFQDTTALMVETCNYRVVIMAFPMEFLSASDGRSLMDRSLKWLQALSGTVKPQLFSVNPNILFLDQLIGTPRIDIQGQGFPTRTGYRAYLDRMPVENVRRLACDRLAGTISIDAASGTYSLRVVTGDGHDLFLPNALRIVRNEESPVEEWNAY